jgi:hypothetical protein
MRVRASADTPPMTRAPIQTALGIGAFIAYARPKMTRVMVFLICAVGFLAAVVGVLAGLASIGLGEADLISADFAATLGVVSILCSLIALPIGIIGWRWAERRGEPSVLGQAAGLTGGTALFAWFALLVYALSQDTP